MKYKFFLVKYIRASGRGIRSKEVKRNLTIQADNIEQAQAAITADNPGWEVSMFWSVWPWHFGK